MRSMNTRRRLVRAAGLVAVVVSVVLVGAATNGRAATVLTIQLDPLIGSGQNVIQQVSYGGNIGYGLSVHNTGDSVVTKVTVVVTSDLATFLDDDSSLCVGSGHQMTCTPPGGTLAPGDGFTAKLRFTAPLTGAQVTTHADITVGAQTVGGSNNQGTTLTSSAPVVTTLGASSVDSISTYLRGNEGAHTGNLGPTHPQRFVQQMPSGLLGDFGTALSLLDESGTPICATCLPWFTSVTIPAASHVLNAGNPFYDGTTTNPYSWTMEAQYPAGFKVSGVAYLDDDAVLHFPLPSCASVPLGPLSPVCVDSVQQNPKTKTVTATGRGIENGNLGFG
jgi:hypothetical protein